MLKNKKNILYISIILISIIVFISTLYNLSKIFYIQKKQISSNLVQKEDNENPINTIKTDEIVTEQYKSTNNWRIVIPKINVNAPILEGTTKEILRRGVGHFENTSKWNGNICLAAHNRGYKYNYFQEIKNLIMGDIIIYETEEKSKKYEVFRNETIKETDLECIEDTKENQITLLTCEENKREYRRCVQAKEI